jgi:dUTP pyrophosphatase
MKLKIKRFDTSLPLPEYKSKKAAALDLYSRLDIEISAQSVMLVPLNIALELPANHWVLLAARSSLFKKGLWLANGIGVGDEDYCGNDDEYKASLFNFTKETVKIEKGERIVQMIVLPREPVTVEGVEELTSENRGGFGSTGKK